MAPSERLRTLPRKTGRFRIKRAPVAGRGPTLSSKLKLTEHSTGNIFVWLRSKLWTMENVTNGAPTANLISALGGAHFLLLKTNLSGWFDENDADELRCSYQRLNLFRRGAFSPKKTTTVFLALNEPSKVCWYVHTPPPPSLPLPLR